MTLATYTEDEDDGYTLGTRAPVGGVAIAGRFFRGGQFIPGDVVAEATPQERKELVQGKREDAAKGRAPGPVAPHGGAVPAPAALTSSSHLFHEPERTLPAKRPNAASSEEDLYTRAQVSAPIFQALLDHGKGVDKSLRATVPALNGLEDFHRALEAMKTTPGPFIMIAPLKGAKRAREKVAADYGGDWSKLHDVLRATIAVDHVADMPQAVEALRTQLAARGWTINQKPKNRFEKPLPSGYR